MAIPKSFKLFGSDINVIFDNDLCNAKSRYGESRYSTHSIILSNTDGVMALPTDKIEDTFYHEKVHMILDMMKEYKLSENEKFVDVFSKLLRQSEITSIK